MQTATKRDLGPRVLRKLTVLAAGETPDADDIELVNEKLDAVHAALRTRGLLRWTLNAVPDYAQESYVLMAAFLAAPEFQRVPDPTMWSAGMREIESAIALTDVGTIRAEYF
ncbi:hypothetical protein D3C71_597470 [compost metagenome]